MSISTPPPRIPRRTVVTRDFPESRRSSRPPLSDEERPAPRSTPGVVVIAGPEILPPDAEACQSRHCALHRPRVLIEERVLRADDLVPEVRPIHPAHAVVASPPSTPLDGAYWRRVRGARDIDSHGPAAS